MRVLLVEDEAKLAALVARGLTEHGDVVDVVGTGDDAIDSATSGQYDVILLDVRLPDVDGFQVCRRLRAERVWTPILMLTARTAVVDRIAGLDSGADDYLGKPFAFEELLARMRALARRGPVARPTVITVGDLRLDPAARRVWRGDDEVSCRPGVRAPRGVHAAPGAGALPRPAARPRVGRPPTTSDRTSWTSTSATCGRRSTDRSA